MWDSDEDRTENGVEGAFGVVEPRGTERWDKGLVADGVREVLLAERDSDLEWLDGPAFGPKP